MKREQQSLELMRALDAEQDTQRLKLGDSLSTPRPIDHFLYFRSKADADRAALELIDQGFATAVSRKGFRDWLLEAKNESDVELETVDALSDWMFAFAQRHDGIYDGWGAPIVLGKQP
jgi:regulator of RNase E activity RraB